jgi:hypothetical protein
MYDRPEREDTVIGGDDAGPRSRPGGRLAGEAIRRRGELAGAGLFGRLDRSGLQGNSQKGGAQDGAPGGNSGHGITLFNERAADLRDGWRSRCRE